MNYISIILSMMYKFKLKMKLFVTTKIQTSHIKSFFFKLKKNPNQHYLLQPRYNSNSNSKVGLRNSFPNHTPQLLDTIFGEILFREEKPRETYFVTSILNILLDLLSILYESKWSVHGGLGIALDYCIIRGAVEICRREPFNFLRGNYSVFDALENIIAQCLHHTKSATYYQRYANCQLASNMFPITIQSI